MTFMHTMVDVDLLGVGGSVTVAQSFDVDAHSGIWKETLALKGGFATKATTAELSEG